MTARPNRSGGRKVHQPRIEDDDLAESARPADHGTPIAHRDHGEASEKRDPEYATGIAKHDTVMTTLADPRKSDPPGVTALAR
jgi:hypothetical protein